MAASIVGQKMPFFSLPNADGQVVALEQLLAKGPAVVFFYPKDETHGCIKEACAFRDAFEAFLEAGCQVVGISRDGAASHQQFAKKHRLPFTLLTDASGQTAKAWGIKKTLGLLPGRETFLLGKDGVVHHHFAGQMAIESHIQGALEAARTLAHQS